MAPSSPTVASWAIGRRLREKREESGLSGSAAAKRAGVTAAYLSEVEHGKKNLSQERLGILIDAYDFEPDESEELHGLRIEAGRRGWWSSYTALFNDELLRFFGFEYGAENVHSYDSGVINGLLQTRDYAQAIIEAGSPNLRLAEVGRRVQCRLTRQQRLSGDDPLRYSAVMSEAALRQQIGGPSVLSDQLQHLVTLIESHPNTLDVRVVPFESGGHDAMGGSAFHVLSFASGKLPTLVWQETVTSTQLIFDPLTVREYSIAHAQATKSALSRADSLSLIKQTQPLPQTPDQEDTA